MKILIAYDGSECADAALIDLQRAGLPKIADALMVSTSEIWLLPENVTNDGAESDDIAEYFLQHSEQLNRNLENTEEFLATAKCDRQKHFPQWSFRKEAKLSNSVAHEILLKSSEFSLDLLVIDSHGHSSDGHSRLGSISQKVLTESKCSVRIARTKRDIDPLNFKIDIF